MINRKLDEYIERHYANNKSSLLLKGARQVGKTYAIRKYARKHGMNLIEINFYQDVAARKLFVGAESAIFSVYKIDGESSNFITDVVVTNLSEDNVAAQNVWVREVGRYKVIEKEWTWSHGESLVEQYIGHEDPEVGKGTVVDLPTRSITRTVNDKTADDSCNGTLYRFVVDDSSLTEVPDHAESVVKNDFSTVSESTTPVNGVTSNSKPQPGETTSGQ